VAISWAESIFFQKSDTGERGDGKRLDPIPVPIRLTRLRLRWLNEKVSFPEPVWQEFKSAESFGRFYNANIKGRYVMRLAVN
jgi:hypothetical protein